MYQSRDSQLTYLGLENESANIIKDDIDSFIRKTNIMAGITPIVTESIDPIHYRAIAMTYLKTIARKPVEVYTKLYDLHMVDDFVSHAEEFKKYLKGRSLLDTDIVMSEWDRYYTLMIKSGKLPLKDVNIESVREYDALKNREKLQDVEGEKRKSIEKYQREERSRLKKRIREIKIAMLQTRNQEQLAELEQEEEMVREELKELEEEKIGNISTQKQSEYLDITDVIADVTKKVAARTRKAP